MLVAAEHLAEVFGERIEMDEMRVIHFVALGSHALQRARDGAPGGTPAEHQQVVGVFGVVVWDFAAVAIFAVSLYPCIGDVFGDAGDFVGSVVGHHLVIQRVVGDIARAVFFLQPAFAVHETGGAGDDPRRGQSFRVALIWPEMLVAVFVYVVRLCDEVG